MTNDICKNCPLTQVIQKCTVSDNDHPYNVWNDLGDPVPMIKR